MKIDITRLLLVIVGFYIAQILLHYFLVSLGFSGLPLVITYNILLAFIAALIYFPPYDRKGIFKNPEFYKYVGIFALIFMLLSLVGI